MRNPWITTTVLPSVLVLALGGCSKGGMGQSGLAVSTEQLVEDYTADPAAADGKYKGKALVLDGAVVESFRNAEDPSVLLYQKQLGQQGKVDRVQCFFVTGLRDKVVRLSIGQTVKVRAQCDGIGAGMIRMIDGGLVEVGPDRTIETSAIQLATDHSSGAGDRYYGKTVSIEGVVEEERPHGPPSWLILAGAADKEGKSLRVAASDTLRQGASPFAGLKKGQMVKVIGECMGRDQDKVVIEHPLLIGGNR